jgi:hypothetical protein
MEEISTTTAANRGSAQTAHIYSTSLTTRIKAAIIKVGTWLSWAGFAL